MEEILAQAIAKDPVPTDMILVADPTSGVAGKSTIAQILGTFTELDAKTPLNTDLVPVADPVTGIAGKSSVKNIFFGETPQDIATLTVSAKDDPTYEYAKIFTMGVTYSGSNRTIQERNFSPDKSVAYLETPVNNIGQILLLCSHLASSESPLTQIVINASELTTTGTSCDINNAPNVTSFSAPNLKIGSISNAHCYRLTTFSVPNLEYGFINLSYMLNFTGAISFPKLKVGGITLGNATTASSISAPELISADISIPNATNAPNFTSISFPKLKYIGAFGVDNANITTISLPEFELQRANSNFSYAKNTIQTLDLPKCKLLSSIFPSSGSANIASLTTLNLPLLKNCYNGLSNTSSSIGFALLQSINLPELIYWGAPRYNYVSGTTFNFSFENYNSFAVTTSSPNLTTISVPKMKFCGTQVTNVINITAAPNLSTFTVNSTPSFYAGNIIITGAALNQESVDGILVALAYMDGTANAPYPAYSSKTINLSGGTSATPSATGLAAKATLVARGCTVTHN